MGTVTSVPSEGLQEKRYVTVILRLLLDKHGELVHGEVADMDGRVGPRFGSWDTLAAAVDSWLAATPPGG